VQNLSYGNEFNLQDNECASKTHFYANGLCSKTCFETEVTATQEWLIKLTASDERRQVPKETAVLR